MMPMMPQGQNRQGKNMIKLNEQIEA